MLLLIVFSGMSFVSLRYMIFYMCIPAPILARISINLRDERVFARVIVVFKKGEGIFHVVACIIGIVLFLNAIPALAKFDFREETFFYSPKGAADFLGNVKIKGNMFNNYAFGGYLIWRLYPDKKVFFDSRGLEPDVYMEYQNVINVNKTKPHSWDDIIKKYNISYVVMPPIFKFGRIYDLVEQLFISDDWVLIYMDHLSLIFLRNDPANSSVIEKFAIDKRNGLYTIITQTSARAMEFRDNPYYLISIGEVFFMMGKFDDVEKAFKMAYERDPDNEILGVWMGKIKIIKASKSG